RCLVRGSPITRKDKNPTSGSSRDVHLGALFGGRLHVVFMRLGCFVEGHGRREGEASQLDDLSFITQDHELLIGDGSGPALHFVDAGLQVSVETSHTTSLQSKLAVDDKNLGFRIGRLNLERNLSDWLRSRFWFRG